MSDLDFLNGNVELEKEITKLIQSSFSLSKGLVNKNFVKQAKRIYAKYGVNFKKYDFIYKIIDGKVNISFAIKITKDDLKISILD